MLHRIDLIAITSEHKKRKEKLKFVNPDCPRLRKVVFIVLERFTETVATSQRLKAIIWLKAF